MPMTSQPAGHRFAGRVVLVTGGGSGIGRACAHRLAAEEARVVVADLDRESAERTAGELDEAYDVYRNEHLAVWMDVTDRASVDDAVGHIVERAGRLDGLVAVAGGDVAHPGVDETDDEVWRAMLDLNLLGTVRACRAAIPHLRRSDQDPAIVMVSSVNGLTGIGSEPYSSAKAGLHSLTQNLAVQLGPDGIRVNTVAPGTVRTRAWEGQPGGADRMAPLYPLGRVGEPEDIAAAFAYLLSCDAGWVTGVVLPVDGGLLAGHRAP